MLEKVMSSPLTTKNAFQFIKNETISLCLSLRFSKDVENESWKKRRTNNCKLKMEIIRTPSRRIKNCFLCIYSVWRRSLFGGSNLPRKYDNSRVNILAIDNKERDSIGLFLQTIRSILIDRWYTLKTRTDLNFRWDPMLYLSKGKSIEFSSPNINWN